MKISSETKAILKNFATINSGIKVDSGNQLKTISNMKNILAVANVPETFNQETISHFPGGPGNHKSKIVKMKNYENGEYWWEIVRNCENGE